MRIMLERTDTFGGEANYSWVRRGSLPVTGGESDRAIVRRAKAWAGWTGMRAEVTSYGDMIEIRPRGLAQVLFITWEIGDVGSPDDNPYIFHPRSTRTAFVTPRSLEVASDWMKVRDKFDD